MIESHPGPLTIGRLLSPRWMVLVALLAVEVVGLTLRFSAATAAGPLTGILSRMVSLGFQLVVGAASMVLLAIGASDPRPTGGDRGEPTAGTDHRPWSFLLAHLTALVAFYGLTVVVLEGGARPLPSAMGVAVAWASLGLATFVTWIGIGLPPGRWLDLLRRGPGLLMLGTAAGLAIWGAGAIAASLWYPLGRSTIRAAFQLLRPFVDAPFCSTDTFHIGSATFWVEIAPACSGYEGIGLVLLLTTSYLWVTRRHLRFPRVLILLPLGIGVIWLANVVRIAALVTLGSWGYGAIALEGFHSHAGWLAFDAIGLGLVLVASRWSYLHAAPMPAPSAHQAASWPSGAYLAPFLAVIAAQMITAAFSDGGVDHLYPIRVAAGAGILWCYRRRYAEIRWSVSWEAVGIGVAAFAVWIVLEPWAPARKSGPPLPISDLWPGWAWTWLIVRIAGSIVIVPLAEELAFRAYLIRRLIAPRYWSLPIGVFSWPSFLISSALFGMLHGRWIAGTLAGALYALALYRRRELSDAVVAHATTNALIAALVVTMGDGSLWT